MVDLVAGDDPTEQTTECLAWPLIPRPPLFRKCARARIEPEFSHHPAARLLGNHKQDLSSLNHKRQAVPGFRGISPCGLNRQKSRQFRRILRLLNHPGIGIASVLGQATVVSAALFRGMGTRVVRTRRSSGVIHGHASLRRLLGMAVIAWPNVDIRPREGPLTAGVRASFVARSVALGNHPKQGNAGASG